MARGTKITLYIKEDQTKYIEEKGIKEIVKKHSQLLATQSNCKWRKKNMLKYQMMKKRKEETERGNTEDDKPTIEYLGESDEDDDKTKDNNKMNTIKEARITKKKCL